MKGVECLVTLLISLEIKLIFCAAPVWDTPREASKTDSVLEDVAGGSNIYSIFANDADSDTLTYSIVSQDPSTPAFTISGSDLQLPAAGVDAETETEFKLIFSVSDGNGNDVTSVEFTMTITDVNDNTPMFTPTSYTGSLTDGAAVGTSVFTLTASGVDVSNSLTYAITLGNTPDTFEVDSTGMVKVKVAANVDSTTTPSYSLTVTATESLSGDVLTATGEVTVTAVTTTTTTTVATDPRTGRNSSGLSGGEIAGSVVGIVVGIVVVAAGAAADVVWGVSKKHAFQKQSKIKPSDTGGETIDSEKAEIDDVNGIKT